MKKYIQTFLFVVTILFSGNVLANEINRIKVGNEDAKITIIAYESLTCSHCAK